MNTAGDNLDPQQQRHFDSLADDWWNPHGRLKTLHAINPVRLQYIRGGAGIENRRVLDIGCGGGLLCEAMAANSARVTGIDISMEAIRIAREHLAETNFAVDYRVDTAEAFAAGHAHEFDVVTCMEMLEHVPDPAAIIEAAARLLQPGGHAFFATINRTLQAYLTMILGAERLLGLLPEGTHDYKRFIRPSELCRWLRSAGFEIADITGMYYLPRVNRAALSRNPSVNEMLHAILRG